MNKRVSKILEEISEEICDGYCKYPERYLERYQDPDDANETMLREKCTACPLMRL